MCRAHLAKIRMGGDVSAIKAFQDEVNFRTFARSSLSPKKRDSESPTRQKDFASVLQQ